jgi:hypothetical protein
MRFMMLYKPGRDDGAPPRPEVLAKLRDLTTDAASKGILLANDGLQSSANGARVRINGKGSFTVIDGPFAEAKEVIAGFAIMAFDSKEDAIESAKQFLSVMGEGETEVRPMFEPTDFEAFGRQVRAQAHR